MTHVEIFIRSYFQLVLNKVKCQLIKSKYINLPTLLSPHAPPAGGNQEQIGSTFYLFIFLHLPLVRPSCKI